MAKQEKLEVPVKTPEETEYKTKVLFLRKSKAGKHLYAFQREGILGEGIASLIVDVSEVKRLIEGSTGWIKVGAVSEKEEEA